MVGEPAEKGFNKGGVTYGLQTIGVGETCNRNLTLLPGLTVRVPGKQYTGVIDFKSAQLTGRVPILLNGTHSKGRTKLSEAR